MKIKVEESNAVKLTTVIENTEKRCSARTIQAKAIFDAVEYIEKRLSGLLYKKDWTGITISVEPNAQTFPGAYKGTPESTIFMLMRGSDAWFITDIYRGICGNTKYTINLNNKATAIAEFVSDKF